MRLLLAALFLFSSLPSLHAQTDDDAPAIQRRLAGLALGDKFKRARALYPSAVDWPATEVGDGVVRYRLERPAVKTLPSAVDLLFLGFRKNRLVEIQAVYGEKKSRAKPVETLAGDYALFYGEAKRAGEKFWWSDGKTILRIFSAEIPASKTKTKAVILRTSVQVFDADIVGRGD